MSLPKPLALWCPALANRPAFLTTSTVPSCLQAAFEAFEAWHEEKGRLLEEADSRIAQLEQHTQQLQEELTTAQETRWAAAQTTSVMQQRLALVHLPAVHMEPGCGLSCRQQDGELQHTLSELTARLQEEQAAHAQLQAAYSTDQAAWAAKEEGLAGVHRWQHEAATAGRSAALCGP